MNLPANFSEADWKVVSSLPSMVGGAAAVADNSGIFGMLKESMANVRAIMDGLKSYPNNDLISAMTPTRENAKEMKDMAMERRTEIMTMLKEKGVQSSEALVALTLEEAARANSIIDANTAPETAVEFKAWIIEIATKVINSAKEGGKLGFGGVLVSEKERQFLEDLKNVLC